MRLETLRLIALSASQAELATEFSLRDAGNRSVTSITNTWGDTPVTPVFQKR